MDLSSALRVYHGCFLSVIRYSIVFWGGSVSNINTIFKLQKRAIRIIFKLKYNASCRPIFQGQNLLTVPALYFLEIISIMKKNENKFINLLPKHYYNTRRRDNYQYPIHKTALLEKSPAYMGLRLFNALPSIYKEMPEKILMKKLAHILMQMSPYSVEECVEIFGRHPNTYYAG